MRNRWALIFISAALVVYSVGKVDIARAENYGAIPSSRIFLGRGFDPINPQADFPVCVSSRGECQTSASGSIACLGGSEQKEDTSKTVGITTSFKVKQIQSKYEFFREVNIQASLSGSYGPFSGSGSFSSFSLDDIKEDSLTWIVVAKGSYGSFGLMSPGLLETSKNLKPLALIGKCGTSYVSQVDKGVLAAAIFSVYNLDEKHRREIRASMSAGFSTGAFGADASATFTSVMKTALQYGTMNINVYAMGGRGPTALAELINTTPTDLEEVRKVLAKYVEHQDRDQAAIVGFTTTGFGKLTNNPSIDPEQTNFVYFLENANEYRLRILDGITRVNALLERQFDFPPSVVRSAQATLDELNCEAGYIEDAMQACRMSFELSNFVLVDGDAKDDRAAGIAQRYGMPPEAISKRLRLCESAQSNVAQVETIRGVSTAIDPRALLTFGWSRTNSLKSSDPNITTTSAVPACRVRVSRSQTRFAEMIRSALTANEKGGAVCVTGCEFQTNHRLLSELNKLPTEPFQVSYWFDSLQGGFGGSNNPGLYVVIKDAAIVRTIRAYNNSDTEPFGIRTNPSNALVSLFFAEAGLKADLTVPVRLEIETINGNTYTVLLPKIKLM